MCLKVNSTHIFFSGGLWGGRSFVAGKAYLLDWVEAVFVEIPDMPQARENHACSVVNGETVIVTGGYNRDDW